MAVLDESDASPGDAAAGGMTFKPLPRASSSVAFDVAGITVRLDGFPVGGDFLDRHYPGFHRPGSGRADVVVDLVVDERGMVLPLPRRDEPPVVEVQEAGADGISTRSHWHEGRIDFAIGRGAVTFTDLRDIPFRMSLENFLRVTFAGLLLRRGACLLHAAAVVKDGHAFVFFGLSGSGKSSIVAMSPDLPSLSDDLIALVVTDGRLEVERVPFYGLWPSTARHAGRLAVARLLHLVPSPAHAIVALPRVLQVMHLRAAMPFLAGSDARALDVVEAILVACPAEELRFARDAGFWDCFR